MGFQRNDQVLNTALGMVSCIQELEDHDSATDEALELLDELALLHTRLNDLGLTDEEVSDLVDSLV